MSALGLLAGIGSVAGAIDTAKNISQTGADLNTQLTNMGNQLAQDSEFKGYGVTTGMGNVNVAADGSTSINGGIDQNMQTGGNNMLAGAQAGYGNAASGTQAYQPGLQNTHQGMGGMALQAAQNSMQPTANREQDIYSRMMAAQQPGLDRAQAAQQAREYAMGRGGVMGSQFGGTAEDAAMAQARVNASNQAYLGAMNQAQQEMMNQGQLAQMYGNVGNQAAQIGQQGAGLLSQIAQGQGQLGLGMNQQSYMPYDYLLKSAGLGGANADRAQTGQLTGLGYQSQLGLGGAEVNVNAEKASSELLGNLYDSILDNASAGNGLFGFTI